MDTEIDYSPSEDSMMIDSTQQLEKGSETVEYVLGCVEKGVHGKLKRNVILS